MARTVVPPPPKGVMLNASRAGSAATGDTLPERLIKYVPAETLAFFVPIAAILGANQGNVLFAALVASAIGTVGYLWLSARALPPAEQPLPHFYVLAVVAFGCWSLTTAPNVRAVFNIDETTAAVILPFSVFLIPLADGVLSAFLRKQ